MDKAKAAKLMESFPTIPEELLAKVKAMLNHHIIIDKYGNAHCTACGGEFHAVNLKHRQETQCPICADRCTVIYNYYNFSGRHAEDQIYAMILMPGAEGDKNLYISCVRAELFFCLHQYDPNIVVTEMQRYIYTEKQSYRYGKDYYYTTESFLNNHVIWHKHYKNQWTPRTKVTEPVFDNVSRYYEVIIGDISNTCMRYSAIDLFHCSSVIEYLRIYKKYPGIERLIKCGVFKDLISIVRHVDDIDWGKTELHKMLGINKAEYKAVAEAKENFFDFKIAKKKLRFANTPERVIKYMHAVRHQYGILERVTKLTGISAKDICDYLIKQRVTISDYDDYLRAARCVNFNVKDKQIALPKDLHTAHNRVVAVMATLRAEEKAWKNAELQKKNELFDKQREKLEYSVGEYIIRKPNSLAEIVAEGQALRHCVAGYTGRHANGELTIMFLRRKSEPDTPYYTIEVSKNYQIVQCRGYKNNWTINGGEEKPPEIVEVEKQYQNYLDGLAANEKKKRRKTA